MSAPTARPASVPDYLAALPESTREAMDEIRTAIREIAPDARETISYNIPCWVIGKHRIYVAAWKQHLSLYPVGEATASAIPGVAPYLAGRGTMQIPLAKPLPIELIRDVVRYQLHRP